MTNFKLNFPELNANQRKMLLRIIEVEVIERDERFDKTTALTLFVSGVPVEVVNPPLIRNQLKAEQRKALKTLILGEV